MARAEQVYPVRRLAPDGFEAWKQVLQRGYEGLVAKDPSSLYVGGRSLKWLKVKQPGWTHSDDRWRRRLLQTK